LHFFAIILYKRIKNDKKSIETIKFVKLDRLEKSNRLLILFVSLSWIYTINEQQQDGN